MALGEGRKGRRRKEKGLVSWFCVERRIAPPPDKEFVGGFDFWPSKTMTATATRGLKQACSMPPIDGC
jgi:hypothetical protein